MPSVWNERTNTKLLLVIIDLEGVKTAAWETVKNKMGEGFSAESCRQHYARIKKMAAKNEANNVSPAGLAQAKSTASRPRSTKRSASAPVVIDDKEVEEATQQTRKRSARVMESSGDEEAKEVKKTMKVKKTNKVKTD